MVKYSQVFFKSESGVRTRIRATAIVLSAVISIVAPLAPVVYADRFDNQIRQLSQENSESRTDLAMLNSQEESLQATIAAIQARIAVLEGQIRDTIAKQEALKLEISRTESEIQKERATLGASIKQMYIEGDMSTLEMLASSKDLSTYLDKEEYRIATNGKLKRTVDRLKSLRAQLEAQKEETQRLLADQQAMQGQLNAERAESSRLLSLNQQQQAAVEGDIRANSAKIAELKRQQAIENARNFIGGTVKKVDGSGYPWANAPFPNSIADPWGMYMRQCVSYTAWKVASSGRRMPYWGGRGNAKQWDDNARAAGIPVDTIPRVGDVAVSNSGTYGHVMYVEAVYGDGTIYISQYNASWDGTYSEGRRSIAGLVFIHFP